MKLTTEEYRPRAIRIKCNKCGQWMAHHATAATPRVRAEAPHADLCRECAEAERLRAAEQNFGQGCQCDPPGSGEEFAALREEVRQIAVELFGWRDTSLCWYNGPCPDDEGDCGNWPTGDGCLSECPLVRLRVLAGIEGREDGSV